MTTAKMTTTHFGGEFLQQKRSDYAARQHARRNGDPHPDVEISEHDVPDKCRSPGRSAG